MTVEAAQFTSARFLPQSLALGLFLLIH